MNQSFPHRVRICNMFILLTGFQHVSRFDTRDNIPTQLTCVKPPNLRISIETDNTKYNTYISLLKGYLFMDDSPKVNCTRDKACFSLRHPSLYFFSQSNVGMSLIKNYRKERKYLSTLPFISLFMNRSFSIFCVGIEQYLRRSKDVCYCVRVWSCTSINMTLYNYCMYVVSFSSGFEWSLRKNRLYPVEMEISTFH